MADAVQELRELRMTLTKPSIYYVWLAKVYRHRKWVYYIAVSDECPAYSDDQAAVVWKVSGVHSVHEAKGAVLYYKMFNGIDHADLSDWPGLDVKRLR